MEYVRLATHSADYVVPGHNGFEPGRALRVSLGAVTGQVQMMTNRSGLRFNLYAQIHDKAGDCYLQSEQKELMRAAWGQRTRASGTVSREGVLDLPAAVRQILNIEAQEEPMIGSFRQARGVIPWQPGYEKHETALRRLRDS